MKTLILKEYGCVVAVDNTDPRYPDYLTCTPLMVDGSYDADDFYELTAPESQDFLDVVNAEFGTEYKLGQFAGR